jgi:hypothetical protein
MNSFLKERARPVSGGKSGPDLHRIVGILNRGAVYGTVSVFTHAFHV